MKYPYLFKKGHIGNVPIENRIIMAPMGIAGLTGYNGIFSDRAIDYYERRAIGETGLIITGVCLVNSKVEPWEINGVSPLVTFDAQWKIRNFIQLTERVHDYGSKIFAQLTAGFGRVFPARLVTKARGQFVAPSPNSLYWRPEIMAREMPTEEIETLIESFGSAALIAKASQFDGIELHGHEGYLMDQFTSALWNRRKDSYGGDLIGRMTFPLSIIGVIKEKVGADFPIIYRYGVEHKIRGGRIAEEGIEMAQILEKAGVAALHVDAGCYENWHWPHPPIYQPPGCMVDMAEKIKPHVNIPVITVGRLGYPDLGNRIIKSGKADFIALGRPLLADPDFSRKARLGKEYDIRPCIGCHDCFARLHKQQSLSCAVNPQCGDEKRLAVDIAPEQKKIMIVGGGIAGMEAASICSLRGHEVVICEKNDRLGGTLNSASKPYFKQDIARLLNYHIKKLKRLSNVDIRMKTEVTEELIKAETPDVIFIATGSLPLKGSDIEGLENISFVMPTDVYEETISDGSEAFIIGGGSVGCETALYLSKKKWSVTVAEMLPVAAADLFKANRDMLLELIKDHGVRLLTDTKVNRVMPGEVVTITPRGKKRFLWDLLVLAVGRRPVNSLSEIAQRLVKDVYIIGDSLSPRKVKDAVWEAFKRARLV